MDGEISCSLLYLSNLERWIALFFLAASQCLCISADLLLGIWPLHAFGSWFFEVAPGCSLCLLIHPLIFRYAHMPQGPPKFHLHSHVPELCHLDLLVKPVYQVPT